MKPFLTDQNPKLREVKVEPANDNVSILFIGVDDSEARSQGDSNSRSDALLTCYIESKEINL